MDEEVYQEEVKKETERLIRLQVNADEAAHIIKYYHKNGIKGIRDNIMIDAAQAILRLENN